MRSDLVLGAGVWLVATSLTAGWALAEKRDFQVATGNDDAEESSTGGMNRTSSDLELVTESSVQTVGIRFINMNIPPGAVITSAVLEFQTDETDTGATSLTIRAEDIDDAPGFTTGNSNISNRTLTSASASWNPPAWNTVGERHLSPDLTSVVQEIVDRGGWTSGNDMVFVVTGTGARTAESFNGSSVGAPILRVEFSGLQTTPGGGLCYGAADGSNLFVIIDTSDGTVDTNVGNMGVSDVETIAIDPDGLDVYAADADILGRINTGTGEFVRLTQTFGTGGGSAGNVTFSDVDSLTFEASGVLWGVHARGGADALFQIDPDTGAHIPDVFGAGVDYVLITGTGVGAQIDDIAIDPSDGTFYGADTDNSQLLTIDSTTGAATIVGPYGAGNPDIEGMGFHFDGSLYMTAGQQVYDVNKTTGNLTQIGTGNTLTPGTDYESFDCNFTALTRAVISQFTATSDGSRAILEWQTVSEDGTAGFFAYRYDSESKRWARLNELILPAMQGAPQGGRYRFVDDSEPERSSDETTYYGLLEVEVAGGFVSHGPYATGPSDAPPPKMSRSFSRAMRRSRRAIERANRIREVRAVRLGRRDRRRHAPAVKLRAVGAGLRWVSLDSVQQMLGDDWDITRVARALSANEAALRHRGVDIPYRLTDDSSAVVFYAPAFTTPSDLYSESDAFELRFGVRARVALEGARFSRQRRRGGPANDVASTRVAEEDRFPAIVVSPDPESDYWFWEFLSGGAEAKQFQIHLPAVASQGGSAEIEVALYGATSTGAAEEHIAEVRINGLFVGETRFVGIGPHHASFTIAGAQLVEGDNTVEIRGLLEGATHSIFYLDQLSVTYRRRFEAFDGALAWEAEADQQVRVSGFTSPEVFVWDVTEADRPRSQRAAVVPDGSGYGVELSTRQGRRYLAATRVASAAAVVQPWLEAPSSLGSRRHRADYLVIAPRSLADGAEALASYRAGDGLETKVVELEMIFNEFGFGLESPHAIRTFLKTVHQKWSKPPRYVVFAGEGSWDYRNVFGFNDSLVPTLLATGVKGIYAADNLLADVEGDDSLLEMAVGRIPVADSDELSAYVDKLREAESRSSSESVLLLSDVDDLGGPFQFDCAGLLSALGSDVDSTEISLMTQSLDAARSALFEAVTGRPSIVAYCGHGGLDRLSSMGLLTSDDVPTLSAGGAIPLMVSLSCSTNRFDIAGFDSLGERLIQQPEGGAVAVWAPTGLTGHAQSVQLMHPFLRALSEDRARLGDAVLAALREFSTTPDSARLLRTFTLLGDPAFKPH